MATWAALLVGLCIGSCILVLLLFCTVRSSFSNSRSRLPDPYENSNEPYDNNITP